MSFTLRIESDLIPVEAGSNTPLAIEVTNHSETTDQYELEVEGLDPEWTAVPMPSFSVEPGESQTVRIFFKPERSSENLAGNYPFAIKIRSLETGATRTEQGTLQIKPYNHLSMEVSPKKGVFSPISRNNHFTACVVNLGNSELDLQVFGSDPEDSLVYEFDQAQVTLGPGQQRDIQVTVTPRQRRPFAGPRLHGFTISSRATDRPNVVAAGQAQLEQRPILSPGLLATIILSLLLLVAWWNMLPKPPVVDSFAINKNHATPGEELTLSWQTSNAKSVKIMFGNTVILEAGKPNGELLVRPSTSGDYKLVAKRDNRVSSESVVSVTVRAPEKSPEPEIISFSISKPNVEPGEQFFVNYEVKNAAVVFLAPTGEALEPSQKSILVTAPDVPNTYDYHLTARNASGDVVESKSIRVTVSYAPKGSIVTFKAEPEIVDEVDSKTTITWDTRNAVKVTLKMKGVEQELNGTTGSKEIPITETQELEIIAYDDRGMKVRKKLKVTFKPTPSDDTVRPVNDEGGSGTTGATGTTGTGIRR